MKTRAHHRHHRAGRLVPGRAAARRRATRSTASSAARARSTPSASTTSTRTRTSPTTGCGSSTAISTTPASLNRVLRTVQPDEIYNLGAQSHVRVCFDVPEYTARRSRPRHAAPARGDPRDRASTRALLPGVVERDVRRGAAAAERDHAVPPAQPYACAKVFAYQLCQNYREAYGMFIVQRHPLQPRVAAPRRDRSSRARSRAPRRASSTA